MSESCMVECIAIIGRRNELLLIEHLGTIRNEQVIDFEYMILSALESFSTQSIVSSDMNISSPSNGIGIANLVSKFESHSLYSMTTPSNIKFIVITSTDIGSIIPSSINQLILRLHDHFVSYISNPFSLLEVKLSFFESQKFIESISTSSNLKN
jgi:hypothetical protein